jgi:hypothetical protein
MMTCWHCRRIIIPPAIPPPEGLLHTRKVTMICNRCGSAYTLTVTQRTAPTVPVEPIPEKT